MLDGSLRDVTFFSVPGWPPRSDALAAPAERYVLRGGGPPAAAEEVEQRGRPAIEVVVLWRGDVLAVSHLSPSGAVYVGSAGSPCDVALPREIIGCESLCVALGSSTDVYAVLPALARGWCTLPDGSRRSFEPGASAGAVGGDSTERLLLLGLGHRVHLCFDAIEIQVAAVPAGRAPAGSRSLGFDGVTLAYFGLSSLSVAGLLTLVALSAAPSGLVADERAPGEQIKLLRSYLSASAARVEAPSVRTATLRAAPARADRAPREDDEPYAERGTSHRTTPGVEDAPPARHGVRDRRAELEEARNFGVLGLMSESLALLDDPGLAFHRELDSETLAAMDRMYGAGSDSIGAEGPAGLALSGSGLRGGGKAHPIPLGALGTIGEGEGAQVQRFVPLATEPLPQAVIERAVHAEHAKLRACGLTGSSVLLRFAVQPDGRIEHVRATGSELSEPARHCIEDVFRELRLPHPGSEPVNVEVPVRLEP